MSLVLFFSSLQYVPRASYYCSKFSTKQFSTAVYTQLYFVVYTNVHVRTQ